MQCELLIWKAAGQATLVSSYLRITREACELAVSLKVIDVFGAG
jgi:hypothetical protein